MRLDKRGGEKLLGENTIGLIIAIIGVLLILAVLAIVAGFQSQDKENEQAKATLENIANKMNPMGSGDIENVIVYLPVGWTLVAFDENTKVLNGFTVPSSYTFKNSLCIFKEKKKVFCQVIKAPLLDQNQLFIHRIESYKRFSIGYDGIKYQIGLTELDIKKQSIAEQGLFTLHNFDDGTWKEINSIDMGIYYTVYEGDFKNMFENYWKSEESLIDQSIDYYCNKIPDVKKRFYEYVKCYGVGMASDFSLYTRDTIKKTKEESEIFTDCQDCELGYTDLKTDRTIGRTLFIGKATESLYLGEVVYLQFDCSNVGETCKDECEKWNNRYYVIEGVDPTGKLGNKILLFAGGGKERGDYIQGCLPKKAKVFTDSIINTDALKSADKLTTQLS